MLSDIIKNMFHSSATLTINKLAIITVVYQNYDVLKDFFDSFNKQTDKSFSIFLIDLSKEKKIINPQKFPLSIINSSNKGYAHGVNLGLKEAIKSGYDKFCIINSDTYVQDDFIHKSLLSIVSYKSSIIGGKIYYAKGYEYHKNRYQKSDLGKILWYAGGNIDWDNVFVKHRGVDQVDNKQFKEFIETNFITGCLICFDKDILNKIGFWDESYFLYFEDADFCERAKRKKIKLYYDPSIVIWHKNAQSTDGSGSKTHQKYQGKNRIKFALKYAPFRTKLYILKNLKALFST